MTNTIDSHEYKLEVNPNEYLPLRDVVFKTIRGAILAGALNPGERLMEKQLADQIGVSRTPIREALRKLELEGFVEMVPRKGAMVSAINEKGIRDVLEVRAALEALAAKLACANKTDAMIKELTQLKNDFETLSANSGSCATERSHVEALALKDKKFHEVIFSSAHNDKLTQLISNLSEQIHRNRMAYLKDKNSINQIIKDHNEILDAIIKGDAVKAEETAGRHIHNQEIAVIKSLASMKENIDTPLA